MKLGIIRLYMGESGSIGYYNIQELGLAKALLRKGIKTDIFFLTKLDNENAIIQNFDDGIRIIYISALRLGNHGIVNPKFILDYNLDIIHLLSDNQLMVPTFIKFCRKKNIPIYNYVGTISSDTSNIAKKLFMNLISSRNIKWFKKSMTVAKTIKVKEILNRKKIKNIRLIPVGLDLAIIPNNKNNKKTLREELELPINRKIIIFVGRFEEYKKPLQAIEIMNELNKNSKDYYLVMIGEGSMKDNVTGRVNKYNLNNSIKIIERVRNNQIHRYYRASDIFINLNDKEIFGMSILEAMYQECLVIARSAPGPNFIIDDAKNGILINDYDEKKWAKTIMSLCNIKKITSEARSKVERDFNWDTISNSYIEIFKNFISL